MAAFVALCAGYVVLAMLIFLQVMLDRAGLATLLESFLKALGLRQKDRYVDADAEEFRQALITARLSNASAVSKVLCYVLMVVSITIAGFGGFATPEASATCVWTIIMIYAALLAVANKRVRPTVRMLELCSVMAHIIMNAWILAMPAKSEVFLLSAGLQGIRGLANICLGLLVLNYKLTSALCVISMAVTMQKFEPSWNVACSVGDGPSCRWIPCVAEVATCVGISCVCYAMEHSLGMRVMATFHAENSVKSAQQSLSAARQSLTAFKRMTSAFCDADVRLNEELQIVSSCPKLCHLLMVENSCGVLVGKPFAEFVVREDLPRFRDCISRSRPEVGACHDKPAMVSSRLVRLHVAAGSNFTAELFHVPIVLDGGKVHHLIGIREHESYSVSRETIAIAGVNGLEELEAARLGFLGCPSVYSIDQLTSVSRQGKACQPRERFTYLGKDMLASRLRLDGLEHISLETDLDDIRFPVRKAQFQFSDTMPAADLLTFLPNSSQRLLKAQLLMAGIAMKTRRVPTPYASKHVEVDLELDLASDVKTRAGTVSIWQGGDDAAEQSSTGLWAKVDFDDIHVCGSHTQM
eukprot:gb/GFBE01008449.1/.p1 GENE.gb/GFBE01008449.1/~~gb/GFBE01008449.1/.p1  ORF type:complete len:582 (+),score=86.00 gb/GFBE01008449.1/:1-1746(+)